MDETLYQHGVRSSEKFLILEGVLILLDIEG